MTSLNPKVPFEGLGSRPNPAKMTGVAEKGANAVYTTPIGCNLETSSLFGLFRETKVANFFVFEDREKTKTGLDSGPNYL